MPRLDVHIRKPKKGTPTLSADQKSVLVRVPLKFVDQGGRKLVVRPDGSNAPFIPAIHVDSTVKALARAFRWRKLLENGAYNSIEDLALAEKINASYVSRILRLTLLAPEIVLELLDQKSSANAGATELCRSIPMIWSQQSQTLDRKDR